jgi:hypothetical protein
MKYILPVYGAILVLLVVAALFFLFTTSKIGGSALRAGILFALGSFIFYASDSFLAHGKFNDCYIEKVGESANAAILMVTYYIAQYLLGKGGLSVAIHNKNMIYQNIQVTIQIILSVNQYYIYREIKMQMKNNQICSYNSLSLIFLRNS